MSRLSPHNVIGNPWFSRFNHRALELLFHYIPHGPASDSIFGFLLTRSLVSTWVFGAAFYVIWAKEDGQKAYRRSYLLRSVVAFVMAVVITVVPRPWISWPAPARNPDFQGLYPNYFWGQGTNNCFPSHATLAYFIVAVGFWPINRCLSAALLVLELLVVSLPRIYVGGHYPIDVLASMLLGLVAVAVVWNCPVPSWAPNWLARRGPGTMVRDLLLFIWTFELADGFRGAELLLGAARRLGRL